MGLDKAFGMFPEGDEVSEQEVKPEDQKRSRRRGEEEEEEEKREWFI